MGDAEGCAEVFRGSEIRSKTLKLLETLRGSYKPRDEEVWVLAEVAKLNKLYLAYLRAVRGVLERELLREEARYRWFMRNAVEVISALKGLNYALYKFRKPVEHVSVDLDILIDGRDVFRAVQALVNRGFEVVTQEPYTVTLVRRGFVVDLYTEPSFAWVVYMDGGKLLRDHVEEVEVGGVQAQALTREAEVAVAAAHAVYKEHMVLLMDCLVTWSWMSKKAWVIAADQGVEEALEALVQVCSLAKTGAVEMPYKLKPHTLAKALFNKFVRDPVFRATVINMVKYMVTTRGVGSRILTRLTRKSY